MKKRIFCLFVCMLCLFTALAHAASGTVQYAANVMNTLQYDNAAKAVWNDTVYFAGKSKLYRVQPGLDKPEEVKLSGCVPEAALSGTVYLPALYSDGQGLCALVIETAPGAFCDSFEFGGFQQASLCRLTETADGFDTQVVTTLDFTPFLLEGTREKKAGGIWEACYAGGKLFLISYDADIDTYMGEIDCATGSCKKLKTKEILSLLAYKDNLLLLEKDGQYINVVSYDPATGKTSRLGRTFTGEFALSGLCYDPAIDALYYTREGVVTRVDSMDFDHPTEVNVTSASPTSHCSALLLENGAYYALLGFQSLGICPTDPAQKPTKTLTVYTTYSRLEALENAAVAFMNLHPEYCVQLVDSLYTEWSLLDRLLTKDSEADVYVLPVGDASFDAAYKRGYLAPIASEKLQAETAQMYPAFRDFFMQDNQVLACPVRANGAALGVNLAMLSQMGYTTADIPDTWVDFLNWVKTLDSKNNQLFSCYDTAREERNSLYVSIIRCAQAQGMTMDDPLVLAAFNAVAGLDMNALGVTYDYQPIDFVPSLFNWNCSFAPDMDAAYSPLILRFTNDQPARLDMNFSAAVVNPYAKEQQAAAWFLELVYDNLDDTVRYILTDKENAPLHQDDYDTQKETLSENIALLESQLALDAGNRTIADRLEAQHAELDALEAVWKISPDSLAWYRANAGKMAVRRYNSFNVYGTDKMMENFKQLIECKTTPEEFLRLAQEYEKMVEQEDN